MVVLSEPAGLLNRLLQHVEVAVEAVEAVVEAAAAVGRATRKTTAERVGMVAVFVLVGNV
jgi:hypothetical protein